jgi:hypothetical protein
MIVRRCEFMTRVSPGWIDGRRRPTHNYMLQLKVPVYSSREQQEGI